MVVQVFATAGLRTCRKGYNYKMNKHNLIRWVCVIAVISLSACTMKVPEGITPVQNFQVERYLGTWYEVARMENRFERGLYNVSATYTQNDNGSVKVENRGYKTSAQAWKSVVGKAKFVGSSDVGHLKVSFFGPFYASYVVYELDEDYGYAFVTGGNKKYLWLLAREPSVSDEVLSRFKQHANDNGYDLDNVVFDVQQDDLPVDDAAQ